MCMGDLATTSHIAPQTTLTRLSPLPWRAIRMAPCPLRHATRREVIFRGFPDRTGLPAAAIPLVWQFLWTQGRLLMLMIICDKCRHHHSLRVKVVSMGKGKSKSRKQYLTEKEALLADPTKLRYLASVAPYPKGFASTGTFKLVSSVPHGMGLIGSRSDPGSSSVGCLQTMGRFTGPDRSTRTWDGMPPNYG